MNPEFEDSSSEFISLSLSLARSDTLDPTEGPKRWVGFLYANIVFFFVTTTVGALNLELSKTHFVVLVLMYSPPPPSSKQRLIHDKDLHRWASRCHIALHTFIVCRLVQENINSHQVTSFYK